MKYSAQVTLHENVSDIERVFASEEKKFANKRAGYDIKKGKNSLTFKFNAADATALRAVVNSVAKMLLAYEETRKAMSELDEEGIAGKN